MWFAGHPRPSNSTLHAFALSFIELKVIQIRLGTLWDSFLDKPFPLVLIPSENWHFPKFLVAGWNFVGYTDVHDRIA
jgi:hypothetical protein